MTESKTVLAEASKWPVLKDYRNVLDKLNLVNELDLTDPASHVQLNSLYANYYARLNTHAARLDKPDARVYQKLSKLCNPTIFKDAVSETVQSTNPLIERPATQIHHPLYLIARETQQLMPGSVYMRDVSKLFKEGEIPPNFNPVVIEFALETKFKKGLSARVPLILMGNPMSNNFIYQNIGLISRVVEGLKLTEQKAKVSVNHMPNRYSKPKELKLLQGEAKILDWAMSFKNAWFGSPIVAALSDNHTLQEEDSYFESISLACGNAQKKWQGAEKLMFNGLSPSHDVWKFWSFKNTVYQIRNVATSNMIDFSTKLSADILSHQNIRFGSEVNANLAVHMPLLLSAAFSETMSHGIELGFAEREGEELAAEQQRRENEEKFWASFSL